jgi:hypothetical protein
MIYCFTGRPGSGKTLSAVDFVLRLSGKGKERWVYSNISINDFRVKKMNWEEFRSLMEIRQKGVYLVDEANIWFSSRDWFLRDRELLNWWAQHRKFGVDIVLTSHSLKRLDAVLREIVQIEIRCRFFGGFVFQFWRDPWADKGNESLGVKIILGWRLYKLYDTCEVVT